MDNSMNNSDWKLFSYAQDQDGLSTITENYTYPNSVWGGDYSIAVRNYSQKDESQYQLSE